jgi:hypothetical protein
MLPRPQKITRTEMRASGARGLLIYCSDYRCSHYRSSSGCTHTYGVMSRSSVSLIMWTGGAYLPFRHERHLSEASSFQMGILRGRLIASKGMLALVSHRWHLTSSQP